MKILFVGVFDTDRRSTNTSQLLSFKRLGHEVVGYNYRQRAQLIGRRERDLHLYESIQKVICHLGFTQTLLENQLHLMTT